MGSYLANFTSSLHYMYYNKEMLIEWDISISIILEEVGHKLNITSTDVPLKIRFKAATKIKCI